MSDVNGMKGTDNDDVVTSDLATLDRSPSQDSNEKPVRALVSPVNVALHTLDNENLPPKSLIIDSDSSTLLILADRPTVRFASLLGNVRYQILDGETFPETRDHLFELSGRSCYPQFFIITDREMTYWGDWTRFQNTFGKEHQEVVVLYSGQSCHRHTKSRQNRLFVMLDTLGITYTRCDGADPACFERREQLFQISGQRAIYPQLFLVRQQKIVFWGDYEQCVLAAEAGILQEELMGRIGRAVDPSPKELLCEARPITSMTINNESSTSVPVPSRGSESSSSQQRATVAVVQERIASSANDAQTASSYSGQEAATARSAEKDTDITIYGATSFVAKHVLAYLSQVSLSLSRELKITLAGRNLSKLENLKHEMTVRSGHLTTMNPGATGKAIFDVFVAESSMNAALETMAQRTSVVVNCAGPFAEYSSTVVAACAKIGCDYVDITGEIGWAGEMRKKYGSLSKVSGARIISFCGFDSVPSDLAVYAAVKCLRNTVQNQSVEIEKATTWHDVYGFANGGTIHTILTMPLGWKYLFRWPPFLVDDPLCLAYYSDQVDLPLDRFRNRLALNEWFNQLPMFDWVLTGFSVPFMMAAVNAKVVHASCVALKYGQNFTYLERYLPTGFKMTIKLGILSLVPVILTQAALLLFIIALKIPVVGKQIADTFFPPGTGVSDAMCRDGYANVYAEVCTAPNRAGACDKASCTMKFDGDPGNWVTAQCISEAALSLVLNRSHLPDRSPDGFGTPAELIGDVLLGRLQATTVRPVLIQMNARRNVALRQRIDDLAML